MRVVSLLPAATEIVALLGASEHLVGITHECDYPEIVRSRVRVTRSAIPHHGSPLEIDEAVRRLSNAGDALFTLDEAAIRALHPDLLLTQAVCDVCAVRESDVRALAARLTPTPRVITLGGTSIDGILADIQAVASALDMQSDAEELVLGLRGRIKHVHDTLKSARAPRPRVAVIEWSAPIYIAGHWAPEQIKRAGGVDVLGVVGAHSTTVSLATLAAAEPEFVILAPCGYALAAAVSEAQRLLAHDDWSWLRRHQVWAIDANAMVSRPGPRVVDGIESMARMFNPMLFSAIDKRHAVRLN